MPLLLSRWWYYFTSIWTIISNINHRFKVVSLFLGLPVRTPFIIILRNGLRFKVRSAMDIWVIKETCLDQDYERHGVKLQDGWTVIDIGGGLGDFAIYAAHQHLNTRVYVYEPFPESYSFLQDNLSLNKIDNVKSFPIAVAGTTGNLVLSTATDVAVRHSTSDKPTSSDIEVPSITLDSVFDEQQIEQCHFLKLDCEGGEYDILFNANEATLRRINHISMEYHDGITNYSHHDLVRFLGENGFRVRLSENPAHREIGFLYAENASKW